MEGDDLRESQDQEHSGRCAWKGCANRGEFRAPKDRALRDYHLLCLDHVRAYNAKWDFHAGLSAAELELEIRSAATWDRPTWKLGTLGAKPRPDWRKARVHDPFGFAAETEFDTRAREKREERAQASQPGAPPPSARLKALRVFEMTAPFTLEALRRRYKTLVKKHHPDANGGAPEAETRMKVINEAYQTLRSSLA